MFTIVGIKHKDNVSKGITYHNHYLYCTREDKNVEGIAVEMLSYEGDFDKGIVLGAKVKPLYNKWGRIDKVEVIS